MSAGVYNLLKSHKAQPMSASSLINRLQLNDELLETNLSTMLQTVRGTTQFWFKKQSELRCMVREFGTPTLFLTFSCAEYDSHDIADYLKTVNNVPEGYDVGKLCTEDPISVLQAVLTQVSRLLQQNHNQGKSPGNSGSFYVEEGIPESRCSPLPCVAMDTRCPCHWR